MSQKYARFFLTSLFTIVIGIETYADQNLRPNWTSHQDRTVIGGDVLYLGIGEGDSAEVARFKAEAMSVKGLISECTLAHHDIVIWDRYIEKNGNKYNAFVRAGLSLESCRDAKAARGETRKNLANQELMKDQEIYSELEGLSPVALKNSKDITDNRQQIDLLKKQESANRQKIKKLEDKIVELERSRSQSKQTIVIKETKVLYDRAPANQARYNDCMDEYRQLMDDAHQTALEIGYPKGNLASPGVYPKLNRAESKLRYCQQVKSGKD